MKLRTMIPDTVIHTCLKTVIVVCDEEALVYKPMPKNLTLTVKQHTNRV
jgi:hypothetical protein